MIIANTQKNKMIQQVAATMAIEDMHLSNAFIQELLKVSKGEKTSEQLRQEVLKKYAQ